MAASRRRTEPHFGLAVLLARGGLGRACSMLPGGKIRGLNPRRVDQLAADAGQVHFGQR